MSTEGHSTYTNCRDCNRRLLTADMHSDGLGSKFCPSCYQAAVALAQLIVNRNS